MSWLRFAPGRALRSAGLAGFWVWLIPFALSMPFFDREGRLTVDVMLFKTVMLVTLWTTVSVLMARFLRTIAVNSSLSPRLAPMGLFVSMVWLVMNWGLDFLVVVPLTGVDLGTYFAQTGLRYVPMLATGWCMGSAIDGVRRL